MVADEKDDSKTTHLDRMLVPVIWGLFRQVVHGDLAVQVVLNKPSDALFGYVYFLGWWTVLDNIFLHLNDPHGWHGLALQAQELDNSAVVILVDVDNDKHDLVSELLGNLVNGLKLLLVVIGCLADENQEVSLDETLEDLLSRLVVELNDDRQGVTLYEFQQHLFGDGALVNRLSLVKVLEEDDLSVAGLILLESCLVCTSAE